MARNLKYATQLTIVTHKSVLRRVVHYKFVMAKNIISYSGFQLIDEYKSTPRARDTEVRE